MLHSTPIMDYILLAKISEETKKDPILSKISTWIKSRKNWYWKKSDVKFHDYHQIRDELTLAGNGILLKGERIVLPDSLHESAIQLAHRGSHPGQDAIQRKLRYRFYFKFMNNKVKAYVEKCPDCQVFQKKNDGTNTTSCCT